MAAHQKMLKYDANNEYQLYALPYVTKTSVLAAVRRAHH